MTNLTGYAEWNGMPADNPAALTSAGGCVLATIFAAKAHAQGDLTEVLFEQLGYLIQFSDQERDRLDRVKSILLETFV